MNEELACRMVVYLQYYVNAQVWFDAKDTGNDAESTRNHQTAD